MKRLIFMFIYLLVTPLCKAADDEEALPVRHLVDQPAEQPEGQMAGQLDLHLLGGVIENIPPGLILPARVDRSNQELFNIPDDLGLAPNDAVVELNLNNNHIGYVDPQIFARFPYLYVLNLNRNPLAQENVDELRAAAQQTGRNIWIIADDIGEEYQGAGGIKPAKR